MQSAQPSIAFTPCGYPPRWPPAPTASPPLIRSHEEAMRSRASAAALLAASLGLLAVVALLWPTAGPRGVGLQVPLGSSLEDATGAAEGSASSTGSRPRQQVRTRRRRVRRAPWPPEQVLCRCVTLVSSLPRSRSLLLRGCTSPASASACPSRRPASSRTGRWNSPTTPPRSAGTGSARSPATRVDPRFSAGTWTPGATASAPWPGWLRSATAIPSPSLSPAGAPVRYRVTSVERISKAGLPTEELFDPDSRPRLVVITCGGRYLPEAGGYEDNVVVIARPI